MRTYESKDGPQVSVEIIPSVVRFLGSVRGDAGHGGKGGGTPAEADGLDGVGERTGVRFGKAGLGFEIDGDFLDRSVLHDDVEPAHLVPRLQRDGLGGVGVARLRRLHRVLQ